MAKTRSAEGSGAQVPDSHIATRRRRVRRGDLIVETEVTRTVTHAVVEFRWLVDACVVEDDDDCGAPWEDDTEYGHEVVDLGRHFEDYPDYKSRRGYVSRTVTGNRHVLIVYTDKDEVFADHYAYYRNSIGCTKQTARELAAKVVRDRIDQLAKWYEEGWPRYGVTLNYLGHEAATWGIELDCLDETRRDIADEVAYALKQDGFTVTGVPEFDRVAAGRRNRIEAMRRRANADCWRKDE